MTQRQLYPFVPVNSSHTSLQVGSSTVFASTTNVLETGTRIWSGPFSRVIRLAESSGIDYYMALGTSDVVASSSESALILGGTVEPFTVRAGDTHIATLSASTSTGAKINVTLGYGG